MLELVLLAAVVGAVVKVALADDQSPFVWGGVAALLGIACCMFVPLPWIRVLLAGLLTYGAMIGYKLMANK
jgi:hypothetical protein